MKREVFRALALSAGLVVVFAGLSGCPVPVATFTETYNAAMTLYSGQYLTILNMDGNVRISGWDNEEVSITAEKTIDVLYGPVREPDFYLDALKVNVHGDQSAVYIETAFEDNLLAEGASPSVDLDIRVPNRLILDLTNENGNIEISDVQGDITIVADNGDIDISHPVLPDATESIACNLVYGDIDIFLPEDSSFTINGSTNFGSVNSGDFELPIDFILLHPRIRGTVGSGGATINLGIYAGSIRLHTL